MKILNTKYLNSNNSSKIIQSRHCESFRYGKEVQNISDMARNIGRLEANQYTVNQCKPTRTMRRIHQQIHSRQSMRLFIYSSQAASERLQRPRSRSEVFTQGKRIRQSRNRANSKQYTGDRILQKFLKTLNIRY